MGGSVPRTLGCRRNLGGRQGGPPAGLSRSRRTRSESLPESRKDAPMNGLFGLVTRLDWVVNYGVMLGLLVASVWVWAIVIDKFMLFSRTRKSMDKFEQAFWSGQSLEEL